jgi:antitoxin (DNA-binding transcriptional repressor) of toxin-antitoxin stability system
MIKVSIREFQQKANEYLSTLPILLTRYGMPVAKIVAVDYEIKDVQQSVNTSGEKKILENFAKDVSVPFVKCSFFNCKEEATAVGKVYSESSMDWEDSPMCQIHAAKSLKEMLK